MSEYAGLQKVVDVRGVGKRFGLSGSKGAEAITQALDRVSFVVGSGEFVGIMGPSGSGKSTLLNCLATIDTPTSGQIIIGGRDTATLHGKQLARFRRDDLGFIFQDSNLLDTLSAYENIALALTIQKVASSSIDARVRKAAQGLGIEEILAKYPFQLSGGQKQRVAAARATVTNPQLVLADEPTGALDSQSAAQLMESLEHLNRLGSTILMVTHDATAASYCSRIMVIKDGSIYGEVHRGDVDRATHYRHIVEVVSGMGAAGGEVCHAG